MARSEVTGDPETLLGILAMEFRGTKDVRKREDIKKAYSRAVRELSKSKNWKELPALEDQLPDDDMPAEFFKYWSLTPPEQRAQQLKEHPHPGRRN